MGAAGFRPAAFFSPLENTIDMSYYSLMNTSDLKRKLESALDYLKGELAQMRTGKVTPALLDSVIVNAYNSKMTIKEVGNITVLDAQTLAVSPWDKSLLESIAKAVIDSDLKLNPAINNDSVIIPVPPLTEERRAEFAKMVTSKVEDFRQTIRNIRQDAMKDIETRFANKEYGEDDKYAFKEDVEEIVKDYSKQADDVANAKKDQIMHVGA